MHVRAGKAEDIGFMTALAAEAQEAAHWKQSAYEQVFVSNSPRRYCLVAEQGLIGLGFIVARELETEWEIENVVVEKNSRRQGVGAQLVREILAMARTSGAHDIFLEVRKSNQPARRLYEACGFQITGRRSKYYSDPAEDAVLFRLAFPQGEKNPSSGD